MKIAAVIPARYASTRLPGKPLLDILGKPIRRPENVETTALGAAYLAGLSTGFWGSLDDLRALRAGDTTYLPDQNDERLAARLAGWKEAVGRTQTR